MLHLIASGRSHLTRGEEYKNDKPPQRLALAKSDASLSPDPTPNSVTQGGRGWWMRLSRGNMQTTLPMYAHAGSRI